MSVEDDLEARLDALAAADLLRHPDTFAVRGDGRLDASGQSLVSFCSNDYLGLSTHPALRAAVARGLEHEGAVGAAASRLITGTRDIHHVAEAALAAHVGHAAALLFSTGYAANVGAISALVGRGDVVFSDALNHASLIDGMRLSRAEVHVYAHGDLEQLADLMERHRPGGRAWIVTESLFSMDGDEAPLPALRALADRYSAGLYLDEAHAIGVIGAGRGLAFHRDVRADVVVGTLGKALGLAGAFVAGSSRLRSWLENRARSHVFSTAPPPALLHAVEPALELVREGRHLRERVIAYADRLQRTLQEIGPTRGEGDSPIVPLILGTPERALAHSRALRERGLLVSAIRPPTVPRGTSRLRIVPTAAHTEAEVERLVQALVELG